MFDKQKWIIKKSSKNKNIYQNNEKNIMILLFFIIIFPFCKNKFNKSVLKNPFLDPHTARARRDGRYQHDMPSA